MKYGIDVSQHQGIIDWTRVKEHVDFAIIRAGYGKDTYDRYADRNCCECERLGIPYGLYWFSYAKNVQEAEQEADAMKLFMTYHHPLYPVYYDLEDDSLRYTGISKKDTQLLSDIVNAFCDKLERQGENGCYVGIYTNSDYLQNVFHASLFEQYDKWLAHWSNDAINHIFKIAPYATHLWQCSSKGRVDGISGEVDINLCDYEYPSLIQEKGLNLIE